MAKFTDQLDGTDAVCVLDKGLWDPTGLVLDLRNYSMIVLDEKLHDHGSVIKANMGYENEIRAKAEMNGIKFDIYDWYRNQTWLQEIASTYDASSHGGDKYEKVKRPYGIVHDVVNDMILWTDAGTGHGSV